MIEYIGLSWHAKIQHGPHECLVCEGDIVLGQWAYRPGKAKPDSKAKRRYRICIPCMRALVAACEASPVNLPFDMLTTTDAKGSR